MYFYNSLRTRVNIELGIWEDMLISLRAILFTQKQVLGRGRIVNHTPTSYRDPLRILWGDSYVIRDRTQ